MTTTRFFLHFHLPYKVFSNGRQGATVATVRKYNTLNGKASSLDHFYPDSLTTFVR